MDDGIGWPLFLVLVFGTTAALLIAASRVKDDDTEG
jgi:hypothetical protein